MPMRQYRRMTSPTHITACMAARDLPPSTAMGAASGGLPEWIHLLPAGRAMTDDHRGPYPVANAQAIIAASFARAERLPIDENHATDLAAPRGEPAPAHGWITAMEAREDGIWGKVEWNASGKALVEGRAYRGISPVILLDQKTGKILSILRASLVNKPNLHGLTALHQKQENQMDWNKFLAKLLKLADDATEDQIKTAVKTRLTAKADDGKGGDVKGGDGQATKALQSQLAAIGVALGLEAGAAPDALLAAAKARAAAGEGDVASEDGKIVALQSEITSLTTQLNAVTLRQARDTATAFVEVEIKRGNVGVKPLRDHYIAMHMQDPDRVEKELTSMPALGPSGMLAAPPEAGSGKVSLNAAHLAVAAQLGIDPKDYAETLAETQTEEAL